MPYELLLHKTHSLLERSREISRLKGEDFNTFNVLRVESDEVTVHNRLIAELLNPKGSHGMGQIFLNLFYDQVLASLCANNVEQDSLNKVSDIIDGMRMHSVKVRAEYPLGKINRKTVTGGSIDISVINDVGHIRIENKIYAGDQPQQIERYYNSKRGASKKHLRVNYFHLQR